MSMPVLKDFNLVGGTALSLYYGHRLSVDLDLFSNADFDTEKLIKTLEEEFSDFVYSRPNNIGVFGFIGNIKVDLVRYHYHPLIDNPTTIDSIRLISTADICAMKISAILKRGVKKDFWDIAQLLDIYSVEQLIDFYTQKFPNHQLLISIPQAITYFCDAEESEDPISLKGQTWDSIKKKIQQGVSAYLK